MILRDSADEGESWRFSSNFCSNGSSAIPQKGPKKQILMPGRSRTGTYWRCATRGKHSRLPEFLSLNRTAVYPAVNGNNRHSGIRRQLVRLAISPTEREHRSSSENPNRVRDSTGRCSKQLQSVSRKVCTGQVVIDIRWSIPPYPLAARILLFWEILNRYTYLKHGGLRVQGDNLSV